MNSKWKKFIPLFILLGLLLLGAGIYIILDHVGMATRSEIRTTPADFWIGLWQGIIICLSFIASWYDNNVILYQAQNNGFWYNAGFIFGICIAVGSGSKGSKGRNNKKCTNESHEHGNEE
jgi:hypothetical protein